MLRVRRWGCPYSFKVSPALWLHLLWESLADWLKLAGWQWDLFR
jgi:hypothetical protein